MSESFWRSVLEGGKRSLGSQDLRKHGELRGMRQIERRGGCKTVDQTQCNECESKVMSQLFSIVEENALQ